MSTPSMSRTPIASRAVTLAAGLTAVGLAAVAGLPAPARADDHRGHVVLSGYASRCGALSEAGATDACVYLFVDEVEGRIDLALPSDATLTLERNGVAVSDFASVPVAAVRSAAEIAALYAQPGEARRFAQTLAALDGAVADDAPVTAATFSARLHDALSAFAGQPVPAYPIAPYDPTERAIAEGIELHAFAELAARVDPNVATARYRGYVDRAPASPTSAITVDAGEPDAVTTVPPGFVYYRLVARDTSGRKADLGRVLIDLGRAYRLPAPTGLADVSSDQSRCDAPEQGRSHGVVALTWDHPGANDAERQAHIANTTGYDLWRKDGPCSDPGAVDLAALMLAADASSPDGRLLATGFTQVNDAPILIRERPTSGREHERDGWNPAFSQWTDDAAALAAAGFRPGDQVCYYVVGVDRTGNYGATAGLVARVPDALDPVGPWDVAAVPMSDPTATTTPTADDPFFATITTEDDFFLEWSAVDPKNWIALRADGRAACNTVAALESGRLEIADTLEGCAHPVELDLDVASYVVYRFTSPDEAGRFTDSDGDGVGDADEGSTALTPGASCDPSAHAGVDHRAQGRASLVARADGTKIVRWHDESPDGPVSAKGSVFWYRVASRGANGRLSPLSAPIRGVFFDKAKPERLRPEDVRFGTCGPDVYAAPDGAVDESRWAFDTTGEAAELRVFCGSRPEGFQIAGAPAAPDAFLQRIASWVGTYAYTPVSSNPADGQEVLIARGDLCGLLSSGCKLSAEVVDPRGRVVGAANIPDAQGCNFTVESHTSCESGFVPAKPGDVVDAPLHVDLPLAAGECAGVFGTIGEQRFRLGTLCGPNDKSLVLPVPDFGPAFTCLSVTRYSEGGRVPSTDTPLPCVTMQPPSLVPPPPRLAALALPADAAQGTLSWYGPEQDVAGIIVERWERQKNVRTTAFLAAGAGQGAQARHDDPLDLDAALPTGAEEEWCVRAQAVSAATPADHGGKLSDWTSPLCGGRKRAAGALPEYLPWPALPVPKKLGSDLALEDFALDGLLVVRMATIAAGDPEMPHGLWESPDPNELCQNACGCPPAACDPAVAACVPTVNDDGTWPTLPTGTVSCNMCAEVWKAMGSNVRMVAYRQSRAADPDGAGPLAADVGPWVQASPLLDAVFCSLDNYRSNNEAVGLRVWDPYFTLLAFAAPGHPDNEREFRVYFTDRLPAEAGLGYRFQFVFFDEDGEPVGYRETNWLEIAP